MLLLELELADHGQVPDHLTVLVADPCGGLGHRQLHGVVARLAVQAQVLAYLEVVEPALQLLLDVRCDAAGRHDVRVVLDVVQVLEHVGDGALGRGERGVGGEELDLVGVGVASGEDLLGVLEQVLVLEPGLIGGAGVGLLDGAPPRGDLGVGVLDEGVEVDVELLEVAGDLGLEVGPGPVGGQTHGSGGGISGVHGLGERGHGAEVGELLGAGRVEEVVDVDELLDQVDGAGVRVKADPEHRGRGLHGDDVGGGQGAGAVGGCEGAGLDGHELDAPVGGEQAVQHPELVEQPQAQVLLGTDGLGDST